MPRLVHALTIAASAALAIAGPLTPPAGAPAPTNKTLQQVEPRTPINAANTPGDPDSVFRIAAPGSYYLTADVLAAPGLNGIEIASSDVTLDLNGFTLRGVTGSLNGVFASLPGAKNLRIANGHIANWDQGGLNLEPAFGNVRIDSIVSADNDGFGIATSGNAVVTNCVAQGNGLEGFICGFDVHLNHCVAINNADAGIRFATGFGSATHCIANFNQQEGFLGTDACELHNCLAAGNGLVGVSLGMGALVTESLAWDNVSHGFLLAQNATITDSAAHTNGFDNFRLDNGGTMINCASTEAGFNGVTAGFNATITSCNIRDSTNVGLNISPYSSIHDCLVSGGANAVIVGAGCTITDTRALSNTQTGFQIADDCHVERCAAINNNIGFDLAGTDATLAHNTAIDNSAVGFFTSGAGGNLFINNRAETHATAYSLSAADIAGPIVTNANIATNTNPNANIEY